MTEYDLQKWLEEWFRDHVMPVDKTPEGCVWAEFAFDDDGEIELFECRDLARDLYIRFAAK